MLIDIQLPKNLFRKVWCIKPLGTLLILRFFVWVYRSTTNGTNLVSTTSTTHNITSTTRSTTPTTQIITFDFQRVTSREVTNIKTSAQLTAPLASVACYNCANNACYKPDKTRNILRQQKNNNKTTLITTKTINFFLKKLMVMLH